MDLNTAMKENGVTSEGLARMTGIPKRTIDEYRSSRQKEPSFSRGMAIADALGIDPHELLEDG